MGILISMIAWLFYFLMFTVPLALYPHTSELFEFNKIIVTYLSTILICLFWVVRMIAEKKIIFKRTKLDVPILIFLVTLTITTLFSIDLHTSFYGYYSRFHGGLLSFIVYSLLYWAFVSNLQRRHAVRAFHSLIISSLIVSIYAILQHFGIDKEIWVQDVQLRVFSTLGQPNWLAAWIVALMPVTWIYFHIGRDKNRYDKENFLLGSYWVSIGLYFIYFLVLAYTKSRSGYIALLVAGVVFAGFVGLFSRTKINVLFKKALLPIAIIVIYSVLAGTPFTPSVIEMIEQKDPAPIQTAQTQQTETDQQQDIGQQAPGISFSSTEIRLIVWEGALDVWKNNPVFGTGPETFAYSYYNHRPKEHNLVSEWDFLYNKAHNEYLNQMATTGLVGTIGYLILHGGVIYILYLNFRKDRSDARFIHVSFIAGFVSIIITNFIGFSVVPVALEMFLFPAISVVYLGSEESGKDKKPDLEGSQKITMAIASLIALYLLIGTMNYWRADIYYSKGIVYNDAQSYQVSSQALTRAVELRDNEDVYWQELAEAQMGLSFLLFDIDPDRALEMARTSYQSSEKAEKMSPRDVNTLRKQASVYIKLSYIDEGYLPIVEETIQRAVDLAPTEAKLIYNLGVIQLRLGKMDEGIKNLEKAVDLRPVYTDAHYALALGYVEQGREKEARERLDYVLNVLDPDHSKAKEELRNLDNK